MKIFTPVALAVTALMMMHTPIVNADTKVTIFKVTKVSPQSTLNMRAWPSAKSRIKTRLPYNARDLTETGKVVTKKGAKWLEVNWQQQQGWVNARYLQKTGVLLHANKIASRNSVATKKASPAVTRVISGSTDVTLNRPEEYAGDRYDQTLDDPTNTKVSYTEAEKQGTQNKILSCNGKNPKYWNIKLDMSNQNIQVKFPQQSGYNVPIKYHTWASPNKLRMNIGGTKGRNIVDVNLQKTNACYNDMTQSALAYEVNATINDQYFSGCCQTVNY